MHADGVYMTSRIAVLAETTLAQSELILHNEH